MKFMTVNGLNPKLLNMVIHRVQYCGLYFSLYIYKYLRYLQCIRVYVFYYLCRWHICANKWKRYHLSSYLTECRIFLVFFHRARIKNHDLCIWIDESTLNRNTNIKYIGFIIDHKIIWCEHISHVKNKVSKGVGIALKSGVLHVRRIHTPYVQYKSMRIIIFSHYCWFIYTS